MDLALSLCAAARLFAAGMLWGGALFVLALAPPAVRRGSVARFAGWRFVPAVMLLVAALLAVPATTALYASDWRAGLNPALLAEVLTRSPAAPALASQCIIGILALLSLAFGGRAGLLLTAAAAMLSLASASLGGHAVLGDGWIARLHQVNDALHVLAGAGWVGALPQLWLCLREPQLSIADKTLALRRFSAAGIVAVVVIVVSGVVNAGLVLQRFPIPPATPYETLLCLKVGLVLVMVMLAAHNRFRLMAANDDAERVLHRLRRNTAAEFALGLIVIGLVAVFSRWNPAG